jgi:hypothetical protein
MSLAHREQHDHPTMAIGIYGKIVSLDCLANNSQICRTLWETSSQRH